MLGIQHQARLSLPIPVPTAPKAESVFHQYHKEDTAMFVPIESRAVLECELASKSGQIVPLAQQEQTLSMRDYYKSIPQLNKKGPDGVTNLCNSGVYLTVDTLMGYFEEVVDPTGEKKEVLHIVIQWSDGKPLEGDQPGWVLPGKRDQAYDPNKPDISIEEASLSLVQKELNMDITKVAYHSVIAYFDDRIREPRFKSSGFLSFVLLNEKPILEPGKRIGVPLNGLKLLAERRIALSPNPEFGNVSMMSRNHDSIILAASKTAAFSRTMEKVKRNQADFRIARMANAQAKRPPFPSIDPGHECPICAELLVGSKIVCKNGHTLCGVCLPIIQATHKSCPECRDPLLVNPIANLALERIIEYMNPIEYLKRYPDLGAGPAAKSWENDPVFCGTHVMYHA